MTSQLNRNQDLCPDSTRKTASHLFVMDGCPKPLGKALELILWTINEKVYSTIGLQSANESIIMGSQCTSPTYTLHTHTLHKHVATLYIYIHFTYTVHICVPTLYVHIYLHFTYTCPYRYTLSLEASWMLKLTTDSPNDQDQNHALTSL